MAHDGRSEVKADWQYKFPITSLFCEGKKIQDTGDGYPGFDLAKQIDGALGSYAILSLGTPFPGCPNQRQQEVIQTYIARNLPGHDQT